MVSFVKNLIYWLFSGTILAFACFAGMVVFVLHNKCIDFSGLEHYNPGKPSIVLDDEGKEWTRFQLDRREPIKLEQMPPYLIQAFIAAEDWDFFKHAGISWKGIIRSLLVNAYHGRIVQGASTITQQLVKLLFFDSARTFSRKIKEQLFALLVERQFTKEQILETYLNHVHFGCGIYGVEAASQRFWNKHTHELTIDESATLAGILQAPARCCPLLYPLTAQKRRNSVLHKMLHLQFIDTKQYKDAREVLLTINEVASKNCAPYLKESLRIFLEELLGKEQVYCGGMIIQTTLNMNIQQSAERIFYKHCKHLKKDLMPEIDGALVSMDVQTGEIKALVGGFDFKKSKFNRVLQAKRQIGSIFKPIIYAAALENGMNFADTEIDEPIAIENWQPHNWTKTFEGKMTLAYALARSNNIVAIKIFMQVGAQKVIDVAKRMHLQGQFYPYPSLALGCVDVTLVEALGTFNVFANNGKYIEPYVVKWIKNQWGVKIWKQNPTAEVVLSSRVSGQVAKVLGFGLQRLKGLINPKKWFNAQAISKTGTTNDSRTCWFIGSTPSLTTAVYIGCDDNRSMGKNVYPLRTAFPIWMDFNCTVPSAQKDFYYDSSLKEIFIHERTGEIARNNRAKDMIPIFV